jgi:hypothetical protein
MTSRRFGEKPHAFFRAFAPGVPCDYQDGRRVAGLQSSRRELFCVLEGKAPSSELSGLVSLTSA